MSQPPAPAPGAASRPAPPQRPAPSPRVAAPGPAGRLDALDGLRGAAAVGILLLHTWMFSVGDRGNWGLRGTALDLALGQLRLAVALFFVLSGFLIFRPFVAAAIDGRDLPKLGAYTLRRVARIGPAYWVAMLGTFAVLAAVGSRHALPASDLPTFLLFLQNYDPATINQVNPPTWTIAIEVTFYVAAPILGVLLTVAARRLASPAHRRLLLAAVCVLLVALGAAVLGHAVLGGADKAPRYVLPARMASFGAGMLAAVLVHGRRVRRPAVTHLLFAAGVGLVLLEGAAQAAQLRPADLRSALVDTPASLGFGLIVAAFATGRVRGSVVLERGPLQWYGTVSYGLYLVHFPVIYVLQATEAWPTGPPPVALALVLSSSTVLAAASWHGLEKPAIAWARRRTPSRRLGARSRTTVGAPAD